MSSDYFFEKWKETLTHLEHLVQTDLEYQETKANDKKLCDAVIRLCGMLGQYIVVYNRALDCLQNNLQVQKTHYLLEVVNAVTKRIKELKHQIRKLECSTTQFLGHGLAKNKLTTHDIELDDVPIHTERPDGVKTAIAQAFIKAEEKRELIRLAKEAEEAENVPIEPVYNWWDDDFIDEEDEAKSEDEIPEAEEVIQTRQMASLIQAQERTRQLTRQLKYKKQKRQIWEKELLGTLKPPARLELRHRAAKIIQKVCRAYFEMKRKKILKCKHDELLDITLCGKANDAFLSYDAQIKQHRIDKRKEFEKQWESSRARLKQDFVNRKKDDFADDYRDFIREWFRKWFDDIQYFYDIPRENEGGSVLIMKEETPEPTEWWETYQTYLEDKKSNKDKSAYQLKAAKMEAKEEERMRKQVEKQKQKLEAELMKKIMKNPTMHPGYNYPESKITKHILQVIENYRKDWDEIDQSEVLEVKKKFVIDIDKSNIYAEAKMNIMLTVDEDMRGELNILKKALKQDYENNGEKFPEPMKQRKKRFRKKKKVKVKLSESIAEQMEDLAFQGILKEYTPKALGDFLGDHNYAGDDQRCNMELAVQFCGEARSIWWDRCLEATHGYHKVLLIGPRHSGKTLLVHALATVMDATLFELDPSNIDNLTLSSTELTSLMHSLVVCARAAQPSVIYVKHIHRLYYRKVPPQDADIDLALMKRLLIKKILKKINSTDQITVIGSCVDPWVTKSNALLKQFPVVVLVPDTSYSIVFGVLKRWINDNHYIPRDLDISSLAYVLRGYSYGQLMEGLQEFLTAERIVKMAAHGLFPMEIYNYFLDDETKIKVEYEKYLKWYYDKTVWGKKEKKHTEEQREFHLLSQLYAEKVAKKKQTSAVSSATTVLTGKSN